MRPSPHPADGTEAAIITPRAHPPGLGGEGEGEAGLGGGAGEGEAKEGVSEGDGETRHDALVDAGLAGADEATQLLGAVAHRGAGAALANGHKRGEIVGGDEVGQAVGGERTGYRRGLGGEQVTGDEDEERHGGPLVPARTADRRPARRFHHAPAPSSSWGAVAGRAAR